VAGSLDGRKTMVIGREDYDYLVIRKERGCGGVGVAELHVVVRRDRRRAPPGCEVRGGSR